MTDITQAPEKESHSPTVKVTAAVRQGVPADAASGISLDLKNVFVYYGSFMAIKDVSMQMYHKMITALIGPSGCGKSTLLRSLNRMNDLVGARVDGEVVFQGQNLYDSAVDPVEVRRRIGMVFQKPNPFPKSIFDNVAYGPRVLGQHNKKLLAEIVERSLRQAALWDEVKDNLKKSGLALSGGQQQRLCIARAIAVEPEIILMDEPCSALDPIATLRIEELMRELKENYTIIIVTHNMQQAARVSDFTAFMLSDETRAGSMIEYDRTEKIFTRPADSRTEDYITGRFG